MAGLSRRTIITTGMAALTTALASPVRADVSMSRKNAHAFALTAIDGSSMPMADFAGKVVLLVNTASKCSFTDQYGPLQALHQRYGEDGLVIIGVPSNEFGNQEPGTEDDIVKFVSGEYAVSFPMAAKTLVKGGNAHPLYKWLGEEAGPLGRPRWNFHKYLIGPDGELLEWFTSMTEPTSPRMTSAIERALQTRLSAR